MSEPDALTCTLGLTSRRLETTYESLAKGQSKRNGNGAGLKEHGAESLDSTTQINGNITCNSQDIIDKEYNWPAYHFGHYYLVLRACL